MAFDSAKEIPFSIVQSFLQYLVTFIGVFSVLYWAVLNRYVGETSKLRHIPTIGYEVSIRSTFSAISYIMHARELTAEGLKRWPTSFFKVPEFLNWLLITGDLRMIEEMRKALEHILSEQLSTGEHTFGPNVLSNPYHVPIVRAQLTRALPAYEDYFPLNDSDWKSVNAFENITKVVARISNRVSVGVPLCRNEDYLKVNIGFAMDAIKTGVMLRLFPSFLRPTVDRYFSVVPSRIESITKHIAPIIQSRREARARGEHAEQPGDLLTWLMDDATEEESTDRNPALRVLTLNFAAIHSSSTMGHFLYTLFYLALYPEYFAELREEADEAFEEEGLTKLALDKMVKADSFIREVQRLHPLGFVVIQRIAAQDSTFSDRTFVPAGTALAVAPDAAHLSPTSYPSPHTFDPFRFLKLKAEHPQSKFDLVTTSNDYLAFSHGVHSCPGRYFAAAELKTMLGWLVTKYDVKLKPTEGGHVERPRDQWLGPACFANATAEVLVRRRRDGI